MNESTKNYLFSLLRKAFDANIFEREFAMNATRELLGENDERYIEMINDYEQG